MNFDTNQFVAECRAAANTSDPVTETQSLLQRYIRQPEQLQNLMPTLDESCRSQYNDLFLGYDKVLFEDDSVTVFLVDTQPGTDQPPHNHLIDAFIGVYQGAEINRFYGRSEDGLRLAGEKTVRPGEVLPIRPDTIHAINAESPGLCRAIHIYLGSLSNIERSLFNPDTGEEITLNMDDYYRFCRASS